ncbi:MAG: amidohydrolase family protein [Desulfobacterales bacterium]|nr:amidohydrolase family protein [Desulfobacterales bacterium]
MFIDCHNHLFPPEIRKTREQFFTNESAFELLYGDPRSRMVGARELIASMDTEGIERAVVFGFPWRQARLFKWHNDYIMDAVAAYPERLIGLACFDAVHPEGAAETHRGLDGGLRGVGELAFYEAGITAANLEKLAPVMDICRVHKVPVMLHTNEPVGHQYPGKAPNTLRQIYDLVRRFADNRIILAHWGGGIFFYHLLKKEVKDVLRNVYFDTAASPYLYDAAIWSTACTVIGADRILFGSDYPLLKPSRYLEELDAAGLSRKDRERILGANAADLWGLASKE